MGMCLEGNKAFAIEVRGESFIIHHDQDRNGQDPHPEFLNDGINHLIAALEEARTYLAQRQVQMSGLRKLIP
jgi:hypothetical protein